MAARLFYSTSQIQGKTCRPTSTLLRRSQISTITRSVHHRVLELEDLNEFRRILLSRPGSVLSSLENDELRIDQSELDAYNVDWLGKYRGNSKVVLKPKTTEEISKIVSYCAKNRLAVCPQGGNTGLVGGSVPVFDEVILNLSGINKIRSFDQTSGILSVDAGCILQTVDDFLKEKKFIFPLDLGAKGSLVEI